MSRRRTRPGKPHTVQTLSVEFAPSVYWNGRPFPTAFVVGMPFRYVVNEISRGNIRRSVALAKK